MTAMTLANRVEHQCLPPVFETEQWGRDWKQELKARACQVLQACLPNIVFNSLSLSLVLAQSLVMPKKCPYWTEITPNLFVGGLPLKNWGHGDMLWAQGVNAIVSMVEDHEIIQRPFVCPMRPIDWCNKNIKVLRLPTHDLAPVPVDRIAKAVDFISREIELGNKVYVHCTAGRGRSVSVVLAYLIAMKGMTPEAAMSYIKEKRPQIMVSNAQLESVLAYGRQGRLDNVA